MIFSFEIDTPLLFPYILSQKNLPFIIGLLWLVEKDAALRVRTKM